MLRISLGIAAISLVATACATPSSEVATKDIRSCADLMGQYKASSVHIKGPTAEEETFIDDDQAFTAGFDTASYSTRVEHRGEVVERKGQMKREGEEIVLGTDPIFPGVSPGEQRFVCQVDEAGNIQLSTEYLDYDFDDDGDFESAVFTAEMAPGGAPSEKAD